MSVRINLEKDGKKESGFMGFSWTLLFWGFWVPLFRLKLKDFLMFFIFFGFKIFTFYLFFYQISKNIYFPFLSSYATLIPSILFVVIFSAEIWIAYYYNKYYTENLLADGFCTMDGDEYSAAILKDYSYLPYSKEELDDNVKMEKYRELSTFARKEERSKFYTAAGMWVTLVVIIYLLSFFNVIH